MMLVISKNLNDLFRVSIYVYIYFNYIGRRKFYNVVKEKINEMEERD